MFIWNLKKYIKYLLSNTGGKQDVEQNHPRRPVKIKFCTKVVFLDSSKCQVLFVKSRLSGFEVDANVACTTAYTVSRRHVYNRSLIYSVIWGKERVTSKIIEGRLSHGSGVLLCPFSGISRTTCFTLAAERSEWFHRHARMQRRVSRQRPLSVGLCAFSFFTGEFHKKRRRV